MRHPFFAKAPHRPLLLAPTVQGVVLLMLLALGLSAIAADDLSGYWLGEIGSPREKVSIGLNLQADAHGRYDMQLDLPIAHLRALPLHGKADLDDSGTLVHRSLHMALRRQGNELVGTLLGNGERMRLRRGERDTLPTTSAPDAPASLPDPRWQAHLGGQIFASPVADGGVAYIGTTAGSLYAIDLADGSVRWGSALGYPIYATALLTDDAVFISSDGGYLHRLDRKSGREQWRSSIQDARSSREPPNPQSAAWEWQGPRPLLANGQLHIGGSDGSVQALDMHTGASRWKRQLSGRILHSLASDGQQLFVVTEAGVLQALNARTGSPLWQYRMPARPGAAPVVYRGRVFCNDRSGVLHAVDARTGNALWLTQFWTSWIESEPAFDGNTLYIGSSDLRKVSAIDIINGRVLWRTDVGGWSWGTPLALGDHLVIGMAAGHPYFLEHGAGIGVLDRRDGRWLSAYSLPPGRGFQWGIAGSVSGDATTLVAADIEGVLMGFDLDAMLRATSATARTTAHSP
jgi:outer membrane protein assembly factor BamB